MNWESYALILEERVRALAAEKESLAEQVKTLYKYIEHLKDEKEGKKESKLESSNDNAESNMNELHGSEYSIVIPNINMRSTNPEKSSVTGDLAVDIFPGKGVFIRCSKIFPDFIIDIPQEASEILVDYIVNHLTKVV